RTQANFDETISGATGQSLTSVRRTKRIAKAFTEEQLELLHQVNGSQTDMETIAKIKDEVKRGEGINLFVSGIECERAIKDVMQDASPIRSTGESKADIKARVAALAEKVSELSDDEWFTKYCGKKASLLKNSARFRADALLFRAISEQRHTFIGRAKEV